MCCEYRSLTRKKNKKFFLKKKKKNETSTACEKHSSLCCQIVSQLNETCNLLHLARESVSAKSSVERCGRQEASNAFRLFQARVQQGRVGFTKRRIRSASSNVLDVVSQSRKLRVTNDSTESVDHVGSLCSFQHLCVSCDTVKLRSVWSRIVEQAVDHASKNTFASFRTIFFLLSSVTPLLQHFARRDCALTVA